jgi:hypothetical protein
METPSYESNLARVLTPMKIDDEALTINPLRCEGRIRLGIAMTTRWLFFGHQGSASSLLPLGLVVFFVRQHCSNIKPLTIVMNRSNQTDIIAADIEYCKFTYSIG